MNFFKKTWVAILAFIFIIIGTLLLILNGLSVAEISNVVELVAGIVSAVGLLIIAIKELLQKKDSDNK